MPDDLRVNSWLVIPAAELHERFSRSSGPGGQSVNTADSRVELSFDVEHSAVLPEWARARVLERLAGRLVGGVLTIAASAPPPPPPPRPHPAPGRPPNGRRWRPKKTRPTDKPPRRYDDRNSD